MQEAKEELNKPLDSDESSPRLRVRLQVTSHAAKTAINPPLSGRGRQGIDFLGNYLDALRRVLVRVVAVVAVLGVGAFVAMPWIFDNVIMAPCSPSFPVYELFDRIAGQTTADGFEVDVVKPRACLAAVCASLGFVLGGSDCRISSGHIPAVGLCGSRAL